MTIYQIASEYNSLYICGDIHGNFKALVYNLKLSKIENAVIVVAGIAVSDSTNKGIIASYLNRLMKF